ncbi:SDR family oxidoreductase [Nitratireductor sp. XY-223]|uniref:SDR family oxidoreductase n=1 Tax=Nitratireductor sp. XY-223 TaxID=2561926 RepID=UPI0010A9DDA1|nr:SDR family oxidoreductase [Nitratireductor sp. XY-223]
MRLFIFGAGYSGRAIAKELAGRAEWTGGTSRSADNFPALDAIGIDPFLFDGKDLAKDLETALAGVTHLIQSIAPDEDGDPLLRLAGSGLRRLMPELEWAGYLSTVGVYGDHGGAWVDEQTDCKPVSRRSLDRLDAERAWQSALRETGVPAAVLRLSGIYGPGRNAFVNIDRGKARRLVKPGQVFNRIHVADIAGATAHLIDQRAGGIWNVTDDLPAPPQDVVVYACRKMGVEPPPEIDFETADLSPMARSFYGECKRVSNRKVKGSGYGLRYADYRAALDALWRDGNWAGSSES